MTRLIEVIHRLAASSMGGALMNSFLARFSFALPVKRLHETDSLLAFHHPNPVYPVHILIVPKRAYASWMSLSATDHAFLEDLARISQSLIEEFDLEQKGYRLIVNGGPNQTIGHLHLHLISESEGGG